MGELFYLLPIVSGDDLTQSDKEQISDSIDLLGLTLGYGVEYRFSPQFSLGSEVALNLLLHSTSYEGNYDNYVRESRTILGAVLTSFTMNYYFN